MQDHDWIFDVIMDLCDKADQIGLHGMSAKLEEALDAYLEDQGRKSKPRAPTNMPIVSFGPVALGQDNFALGNSRAAPPLRLTNQPFTSRRRTSGSSPAIQQLLAVRAQREAEQRSEADDGVQIDKAG